jgi:hypothetical protein
MFLTGATWERNADTLLLHFTNGFSGVLYKLTPAMRGAMTGRVWFLYDVINEQPPPLGVTARAIACRSAKLQSPRVTLQELNELKRDKRLHELIALEAARVSGITSLLAGTYEIDFTIDSAAPFRMYGRTELHPSDVVWSLSHSGVYPNDTVPPVRAEGYRLRMSVAATLDSVPFVSNGRDLGAHSTAGFEIAEMPLLVTPDSTVWTADEDVLMATTRMSYGKPAYASLIRACELVNDVWYRKSSGDVLGRFVLYKDGRAILNLRVVRAGVVVLTMHARRISSSTAQSEN